MGNTVSKVVDIGLRAVCFATEGLLGKSNKGYHLGPLRLKKDSIGLEFNFGVYAAGINLGTNDFDRDGVEARISYEIPKVAEGTLRAGIDTVGCYVGLGGKLNMGPLKTGGSIVANREGVRSYSAKVIGPLLTNIKYSDKEGVSGGIFGASVNESREISYDILEEEIAKTIGETFKDEYKSCKEDQPCDPLKKMREFGQRYLGMKFDRTFEEECKLYQERKQRQKDEEDALKRRDENDQYNLETNIWRTFHDYYESFQERRQCERNKKAMKCLREYEQKYLGKKFDRTFEEECIFYQERKQRQENEEDALKRTDENDQYNLETNIWRTFYDYYESYQENRQRENNTLPLIYVHDRINRDKKADGYSRKGDTVGQMETKTNSDNNESYKLERQRNLKRINEYERNNLGSITDDVLKKKIRQEK